MPISSARSQLLIVLCAALGVSALNLFKPMHIDDTLYVNIARHILKEPLNPYNGLINWQMGVEPAYKVSISPPFLNYYFAGIIALFGETPMILHASMAPWLLLLGWSSFRFAERFTPHAAYAALMIVLSPAVMVGTNIMLDVPMTASLITAIEMTFRFEKSGAGRHLFGANFFGFAAIMTKYPAIILLPVIVLLAFQKKRWAILKCTFLPFFGILIWQLISAAIYTDSQVGQGVSFLKRFHGDAVSQLGKRVLIWFAFVGLTFPVLFLVLKRPILFLCFGGACTLISYLLLAPITTNVVAQVMFVIGTGLGGAIFAAILFRRPTELEFLALAWILGLAGFVIVLSPFLAVRSFLPLLLPTLLLLLRQTEGWRFDRSAQVLSLSLSVMLGSVLAWADTRWARVYPAAVEDLKQLRSEQVPEIFFLGHWGWQYYCEKAGFKSWDFYVFKDAPVGSLFLVPSRSDAAFRDLPDRVGRRLVAVKTIEIPPSPLSITAWNRRHGFCFYGGEFGQSPWGFTTSITELIVAARLASSEYEGQEVESPPGN